MAQILSTSEHLNEQKKCVATHFEPLRFFTLLMPRISGLRANRIKYKFFLLNKNGVAHT